MKTTNILHPNRKRVRVLLYDAVDDMFKIFSVVLKDNEIRIINTISTDILISTGDEVILSVIQRMVTAVVANAFDTTINVTAKEVYGNTLEVKIKDENCYNTYAIAISLQSAVPLAEKIGGHLDITNQKQKITTIEFRFPLEEGQGR